MQCTAALLWKRSETQFKNEKIYAIFEKQQTQSAHRTALFANIFYYLFPNVFTYFAFTIFILFSAFCTLLYKYFACQATKKCCNQTGQAELSLQLVEHAIQ